MKKWQEEKETNQNQKKHFVLKIIFVVVAFLLGLQIVVSNTISTSGEKLQILEQRYVVLSSQNEFLKKQIARVSSLGSIQREAEELGFGKSDLVIYLQSAVNVAMK
ncbi:hypothetical protein HY030_00505 [Candidatus Gottesmanbacteria bacterium]|nr:hypothetical protein [Candidatus Gottesmanbacteria bacterium]